MPDTDSPPPSLLPPPAGWPTVQSCAVQGWLHTHTPRYLFRIYNRFENEDRFRSCVKSWENVWDLSFHIPRSGIFSNSNLNPSLFILGHKRMLALGHNFGPCWNTTSGYHFQNIELGGDVQPNKSRLKAVYNHSFIICPSPGIYKKVYPGIYQKVFQGYIPIPRDISGVYPYP